MLCAVGEDHPVAPGTLCGVQRLVGARDELLRRLETVPRRDADGERLSGERDVAQPLHGVEPVGARRAREQDDQVFAAACEAGLRLDIWDAGSVALGEDEAN